MAYHNEGIQSQLNIQCLQVPAPDLDEKDRFNLYEVRVNGKIQGRIKAHFTDGSVTHFSIIGRPYKYKSQEDAVLEAIQLNGRKVPKDAKVRYR